MVSAPGDTTLLQDAVTPPQDGPAPPNRFVPAMTDLLQAIAEGRRPRCLQPWQSLMIDVNGKVQPCAYRGNYTNTLNTEPLGNLNDQSLEEIWNGPVARRVRRCMAAGDLAGAGCGSCLAVAQGQELGLEFDMQALGDAGSPYADNLAGKIGEILDGAEHCASRPTVLYYTPDHRCNLACVHCYQNISRKASIGRKDAAAELLELVPFLSDVVAGGGEPLILPFWRRFLASPARETNPYIRFSTTTNATVLRADVLEQIEAFRRISIIISLDGATAGTFETVRHKAKWDPFLENARQLRALCARKGAFFSFNISTMKANMHELAALIRLCTAFEAPFNYQPVVAYPAAQSLRCFQNAPAETGGWRDALAQARQALEEDYLPAMRRAASENRALWSDAYADVSRGHIEALENLVPWHILDQPFREYRGKLPERLRGRLEAPAGQMPSSRIDAGRPLLLFFRDDDPPGAEPHFFAPVDADLCFAIWLPEGRYRIAATGPDQPLGIRAFAWPDHVVRAAGASLRIGLTRSGGIREFLRPLLRPVRAALRFPRRVAGRLRRMLAPSARG